VVRDRNLVVPILLLKIIEESGLLWAAAFSRISKPPPLQVDVYSGSFFLDTLIMDVIFLLINFPEVLEGTESDR